MTASDIFCFFIHSPSVSGLSPIGEIRNIVIILTHTGKVVNLFNNLFPKNLEKKSRFYTLQTRGSLVLYFGCRKTAAIAYAPVAQLDRVTDSDVSGRIVRDKPQTVGGRAIAGGTGKNGDAVDYCLTTTAGEAPRQQNRICARSSVG